MQSLRFYSQRAINKKIFYNKIDKILIANRGEIACRIIKTARRLGIRTVAVYSDVDKNAMHTSEADEAHNIGPAPSQLSYLRGDKILNVAKTTGCQAIHPGYGFLSENVEFAELCEKKGIIFMGPPATAIRDMGIKNTSKAIMEAAGVPIIKGYHGEDQSNQKLSAEADKIGYPIMIKAVRGGGGKGMRVVTKKEDFLNALESARIESKKAFGDSAVLIERFVSSPRHIEVQVFGDAYGNYVYLNERDCSVQRRHQKIIEEAPAPGISKELREELGKAAVRAAKAVGYVGAGTVEFILDKNDHSFYFMEMNTRLQVEHPITEMITNTDLVEWQIKVASGEKLPLSQDEIPCNGHAFEARVYAESPRNNFLPGAGQLKHLTTPDDTDNNIRVETGVRDGDEVSIHYDPMIAKLVVWSDNRISALNKLISNLRDYQITGLDTNINFLMDLARHPEFQSGNVHTGFINDHFDTLFPPLEISDDILINAAGAYLLNELSSNKLNSHISNNFFMFDNLRINHKGTRTFTFNFNNKDFVVHCELNRKNIKAKVNNGQWNEVELSTLNNNAKRFNIKSNINGSISKYSAVIDEDTITLFTENGQVMLKQQQPKFLFNNDNVSASGQSKVISPMPGVLERLFVKAGDSVKKGDQLAIIIAMKMEHVLKAPREGTIKFINPNLGKNISKGEAVVVFEDEGDL